MNSIDIVIPAAGRHPDLLRLLASLYKQCAASLPLHCLTLTVSDDRFDADFGQQLRAKFPEVRYLRGPARGPAANRNHGAAAAHGDWILFLDDDCFANSNLLAQYSAAAAQAPQTCVFEGAIHATGPRPNGHHVAPINVQGGYLWSCNFLVRRRVFESLGGFDERFPYALEDCDFLLRLKAQGSHPVFVAAATVKHPWRCMSRAEIARQIIGHAIMADKHAAFRSTWTPLHLARMYKGRWRQYRSGRFASIGWAQYGTVLLDCLAPLATYCAVRWASVRQVLVRRYAQVPGLR